MKLTQIYSFPLLLLLFLFLYQAREVVFIFGRLQSIAWVSTKWSIYHCIFRGKNKNKVLFLSGYIPLLSSEKEDKSLFPTKVPNIA